MPRTPKRAKLASPRSRMASYRQRMRTLGLCPIQIWAPDSRAPDFIKKRHRQARAVAAHDPAGDEIMRFVASVYERLKD